MIFQCDNCNEPYNAWWACVKNNKTKCCSLECSRKLKRKNLIKKLDNGCWQYMGKISNWGYGQHKKFFEQAKGIKVKKGLEMDHLCRNRFCVNPDHLEPVTHAENVRRGAGAKLDKDKVHEIISLAAMGLKQTDLAEMYDVKQCNISRIINGLRWA